MIELKKRPKIPESRRCLERHKIDLFPDDIWSPCQYDPDDGDWIEVPNPSLKEIVDFFESRGIDIADVKSDYGKICGGHYASYTAPHFTYTVMEPQEEYDARLEQYKQDIKEYKEWYKANKNEIKATKLVIKQEKEKIAAEKRLEAKKARLKRQQAKINKEMEKLGLQKQEV